MKYPQQKISDLQSTHKKNLRTHKIPTRKKITDPPNTLKKTFTTTKYP